MDEIRHGDQEPTFQVVGEYDHSYGAAAVELFGRYGIDFYPSQVYELELFLARDAANRAAAKTVAISKPRQNGKSFAAHHYAVWMAAIEGRRVLYTCNSGFTAREMFKRIADLFRLPAFARLLEPRGIYRAYGNESIKLRGGGVIEFVTRTNSTGRSGTYDVIVVDEAQEMTDEELDALKPTQLATASADPQMIYIGTPPNTKCRGTVFRALHDSAHAGSLEGTWWLEWAAEDIGDPHDRERWYRCNPALGYRIKEDVMADAADNASSADGFAREYLGWWSADVGLPPALAAKDWKACLTRKPPKSGGVVAFAVKFGIDGMAALAACRHVEGRDPYVEVVNQYDVSRGVGKLAKWILDRKDIAAAVVIDGRYAADALLQKLTDGGLPQRLIKKTMTGDLIAAASIFAEAVASHTILHTSQPLLDSAATTCPRRMIGGSGGWSFASTSLVPGELVEACALALWGVVTSKRKPGKGLMIG